MARSKDPARTCWWCGTRLDAKVHAVVPSTTGYNVWVHRCCEVWTRNYFRKLTAQPPETPNGSGTRGLG